MSAMRQAKHDKLALKILKASDCCTVQNKLLGKNLN